MPLEKTCRQCGYRGPEDEFEGTLCKVKNRCKQSYDRDRYNANRAKRLVQMRAWQAANRKNGSPSDRRCKKKGAERRSELRRLVFLHYGQRCACCGETEEAFLTIDHTKGNGNKHRRSKEVGANIYRWLVRKNFPKEGFQVLCLNCNAGRYRNGGICPHANSRQDQGAAPGAWVRVATQPFELAYPPS